VSARPPLPRIAGLSAHIGGAKAVRPSDQQLLLYFSCDVCGDWTERPCYRDSKSGPAHWATIYARLHFHGVRR